MKVTDNSIIAKISNASVKGKADIALEATYGKDTDSKNIVTWVESHDTYVDSTTHASDKKVARQYAILASKKDSVVMYLARSDSAATVGTVANYFFEEEAVAISNRFHNRFHAFEEEAFADGSTYVSERYSASSKDVGAMVVNLSGAIENKELTFKHLETGIYYDQLTGNKVTVKDNKATVSIGDEGLMVLTKSKNLARPTISFSKRDESFVGSLSVKLTVKNATSASYKINGGTAVNFTDSVTITLDKQGDSNGQFNLEVSASNEQFSITRKSLFKKVTLIEGYLNIININPSYFEQYDFYLWAWGGGSDGKWLTNFTVQDGVILVDFSGLSYTGFLLAAFPKGYVISNVNAWDNGLVKQTGDIKTTDLFYDASNF